MRLTHEQIDATVAELVRAALADDDEAGKKAMIDLGVSAMKAVHSIADSLEVIAKVQANPPALAEALLSAFDETVSRPYGSRK